MQPLSTPGTWRTRHRAIGITLIAGILLGGCAATAPNDDAVPPSPVPAIPADQGPRFPLALPEPGEALLVERAGWGLPERARPAAFSGLFSEEADPAAGIEVRSIDVSWRQLRPTRDGGLDLGAAGQAQGMDLESLEEQLADPAPFWVRLFASGTEWAPEWVLTECATPDYGPDSDGQRHLPLWDDCVWGHLLETYRMLLAGESGLAEDPRYRFAYVPGGFAWAEFDADIIGEAVAAGDLDLAGYRAWHDRAWPELAALLGDRAGTLVYTGEDYPFGPFGAADDGFAADAVGAGLGIRTGITELSNFHLGEAPAYASRIEPNGHLSVDDGAPVHDGSRVVAAENECYTDCGYVTDQPELAVTLSNLKALQLRTNWLYAVPEDSRFAELPEQWDWVRLSLGQTASSSQDAWAALREAEDTAWSDEPAWDGIEGTRFEDPSAWPGRPIVRNLERFLTQVDRPGAIAHRSEVAVSEGLLAEDNGVAAEGLRTDRASGNTGLVFVLDPRFVAAANAAGDGLAVEVTFWDDAASETRVLAGLDAAAVSLDAPGDAEVSPAIPGAGDNRWRTGTVLLTGQVPAEIRVERAGEDDLTARFVRVIRVPRAGESS